MLSSESIEAEIKSLKINDESLAKRVRRIEKQLDTLGTPLWKRIWFRIDGWPPWYIVGRRAKRPWHNG